MQEIGPKVGGGHSFVSGCSLQDYSIMLSPGCSYTKEVLHHPWGSLSKKTCSHLGGYTMHTMQLHIFSARAAAVATYIGMG